MVVGICVSMYFIIVTLLSVHASFYDTGLLLQAIHTDKACGPACLPAITGNADG